MRIYSPGPHGMSLDANGVLQQKKNKVEDGVSNRVVNGTVLDRNYSGPRTGPISK